MRISDWSSDVCSSDLVAAPADQRRHRPLIADLVLQPLAKGGTALEAQRGIDLVRAGVDPGLQRRTAGLGKSSLHQAAVFDEHHLPADIADHRLDICPQPLAPHAVEPLAVAIGGPTGGAREWQYW